MDPPTPVRGPGSAAQCHASCQVLVLGARRTAHAAQTPPTRYPQPTYTHKTPHYQYARNARNAPVRRAAPHRRHELPAADVAARVQLQRRRHSPVCVQAVAPQPPAQALQGHGAGGAVQQVLRRGGGGRGAGGVGVGDGGQVGGGGEVGGGGAGGRWKMGGGRWGWGCGGWGGNGVGGRSGGAGGRWGRRGGAGEGGVCAGVQGQGCMGCTGGHVAIPY